MPLFDPPSGSGSSGPGWTLLRSVDFRTLTPGTYAASPVTISGIEFFRTGGGNLKVHATNGLGTTGGSWDVFLSQLPDAGGNVPSTYRKVGMVMDIIDGFGTYSHGIYHDPAGAGIDGMFSVRTTGTFYPHIYRSAANGGDTNATGVTLSDDAVETTKRVGLVWEGHTATMFFDREPEGVLGEVTPEDLLYMSGAASVATRGATATASPSRLVPLSADGLTDRWQIYDDSNQNFWVKTLAIFGWSP